MDNQRIINDIVVLGQACPDYDRDGKIVICMAGYSLSDDAFVRIFPVHHGLNLRRWDIVQADVELNKRDRRFESWKLRGSYHTIDKRIRKTGTFGEKQRLPLIHKIASSCVKEINDARRSLGIVKAERVSASYKRNGKNEGLFQSQIYGDDGLHTRRDYPHVPYYNYQCAAGGCSGHNQQLLEWGAFEYLRKNPLDGEGLWAALRVYDERYDHYLLVGNQWAHRSAFMVISDLRFKRPDAVQLSLV